MGRCTASFLGFSLVFFLSVSFAKAAHFSDVKETHPNFTAIEALADEGFIEGYGDGTFRPSRLVTRAEMAAMVVRALQVNPEAGRYKNCFDDVQKQWFAQYVCYGKSNLWLSGYPGTQLFKPGSNVIIIEALRMVIDAFKIVHVGATTYLKFKWDVPLGFKNSKPPYPPTQWYEDLMVTARELKFLDITHRAAKMMNRAEVAEIIYRVLKYKNFQFKSETAEEGESEGENTPVAPGEETGGVSTKCTLSSFTKPSHTAVFTAPTYCAFDNSAVNASQTQIQFGSAHLPVVWGVPFEFELKKKSWAMALGYASELFKINPSYLLAVAVKESNLNCDPYTDGCFQISPDAFTEVKRQFPRYIDSSDEHSLVRKFETGVVIAALYFRFADALFERWYQWKNFYSGAADKEARELIMSRGYNRGLWDTVIKTILKTDRNKCLASTSLIDDCFPQSGNVTTDPNGAALDHAKSITDYCRRIAQSEDIYDASLTRADIQGFINDTLIPTYSSSAGIDWVDVGDRVDEIFACLANSKGKISYRYDFKTFLKELFKILPKAQIPQNNTYSAPQ